jgi:sulfatase modifying factor 1
VDDPDRLPQGALAGRVGWIINPRRAHEGWCRDHVENAHLLLRHAATMVTSKPTGAANRAPHGPDDLSQTGDPFQTDDLAFVPGQRFVMGSDRHYPEEGPSHPVVVDGFWIQPRQVTNSDFTRFVDATGYITVAERPLDAADYPGAPVENLQPGSMVFHRTAGPVDLRDLSQWWTWTPGASWRHPHGLGDSSPPRSDHPVVHVAFEDAAAYATWSGLDLPTEAEWEAAARGGLDQAAYVWGPDPEPPGHQLANYWHGHFPWQSDPGYGDTAPVGSFPANTYGLYDMAGNVWEWTTDWYSARHSGSPDPSPCCLPRNPRGGDITISYDPHQPQFTIPRKVVKGGSFLCANSYCQRYRPAARRPQMIDTGMSHIGFRCVRRPQDQRDRAQTP